MKQARGYIPFKIKRKRFLFQQQYKIQGPLGKKFPGEIRSSDVYARAKIIITFILITVIKELSI